MSDKKIVSTSVERLGPDRDFAEEVLGAITLGFVQRDTHKATAVADDGTVASGTGHSEASALANATERALR